MDLGHSRSDPFVQPSQIGDIVWVIIGRRVIVLVLLGEGQGETKEGEVDAKPE